MKVEIGGNYITLTATSLEEAIKIARRELRNKKEFKRMRLENLSAAIRSDRLGDDSRAEYNFILEP